MYSVLYNKKLGKKILVMSWMMDELQKSREEGRYESIEAAKEAHPEVVTQFSGFLDPELVERMEALAK